MTRPTIWRVCSWLVMIAICAVVSARAEFTADLSAFLPRAPTAGQRLLVEQVRDGPTARLILIAIDGADPETRAWLSQALAARLRAEPGFTFVGNGEAVSPERDRDFLLDHRYVLSGDVSPERFSVAGLHAAIQENLDMMASPLGLLAKTMLPRDPTGELIQVLDRLEVGAQPRTEGGVWVSADGKRALLVARTQPAGSDTDGQARSIATLRQAFAAVAGQMRDASASEARLELSGPPVFAVDARATIRDEAMRLSAISFAIIVVVLYAVYRSAAALVLGLLPVVSGALAGVAAVALGFGVVHGITLGFGITLIGETVDYSIYLFIQSRCGPSDAGRDSSRWVKHYWPTVRLGMLTSVCGFASLMPSAFPGLAQLGLYSVAGLIAAALVTRFVLPSLVPARLEIRDVAPLGRGVSWLIRRGAAPRVLLVVPLLLAAAVLYTHRTTLWNRDLAALSPVSEAMLRLDAGLRADLGASEAREVVVVSGSDMESALRAAEQVGSALDGLIDAGVITGFESPARMLPSLALQRDRRAALPTESQLRERLRLALDGLPLPADRLEPFLRDVAAARAHPPLTRADLDGTSLAAAVDALLIPAKEGWTVLLPVQGARAGAADARIDATRLRLAVDLAAPGHAWVMDLKSELDALYAGYLADAVRLSLVALAAIVALLLIALRSPGKALRAVTPLLLAVLVVAAALVLLGQKLTILHLVGMLLTVAVGSNYALFFQRTDAESDPGASERVLASLVIANATTVCAFGALAFSSVPVLRALGSTVAPGTLLALIFSALLSARIDQPPSGRRWTPTPLLAGSALLHIVAAAAIAVRPQALPLALLAVVANHVILAAAGLWPRSTVLGPNWTRLPAAGATPGRVALTIDDGPEPSVTPQVLLELERHGAKATFFCIGERVQQYPDLAREIVRRGHCVENHSQRHTLFFALLGPRRLRQEIELAQLAIEDITRARPLFFRAPAGLRSPWLDPVLHRLGLQLASWTRRGFDTVSSDADRVLARLTGSLRDGDILLLHDGNAARTTSGTPVILEVLPRLLDALKSAGLQAVTLKAAVT